MNDDVPPTISSSVSGPLGLLHLPRLWQKLLLHAAGRLPEGYRHGVGGFDELLCTSIGVESGELIAYVEKSRPSYLELEAWIRERARDLNAQHIEAFNATVLARDLPTQMMEQRCAELGIEPGTMTRAVALNDLDDWSAFHRFVTGAPPS